MARFGIVSGLLLCIDTAFALFGSADKAAFLFLPMMLGIPILFFGVVALNPHRRRQSLMTAAILGGIGIVVGFGQLFHLFSLGQSEGAVTLHNTRIVSTMVAICIVFSLSYVWSIVSARRQRRARPSRSLQGSD